MKNEIIIFENQNVKLEVNMKDETVWLSLEQLALLFDRDKSVISRHIKNILKEELDSSVVANFATTAKDGKIYQVDYLLKGYATNQKRLEYLEKTVQLIDIAGRIEQELNSDEAKSIIKVIDNYSKGLNLLDEYDHKKLVKPKGTIDNKHITYDECLSIISLLKFNSESNLFALERDNGLKSIIKNIYLSYDNKDLYVTVEEKAANFLYLITKNHVFIDGNKRIAATLFIYFLFYYDILYKNNKKVIDNNTLAAVTLLIAQSNPKEKDIIIDLIMNFLNS